MKRKILLFFVIILLTFISVSIVTAQSTAYDEGFVWVLKPELEYDSIFYCLRCDVLKDIIDLSNIKAEIEKQNDNGTVNIHTEYSILRHMWTREYHYFFDAEKEVFVIVYFVDGENYGGFDYYTLDEFDEVMKSRFGDYENYLMVFQKISFNKDKYDIEFEKYGNVSHHDYEDYFDFYGKYALMRRTEFITDFIYDGYNATDFWFKGTTFIGFQFNNKWGIVDKNGKAMIPFIFDDIEFINEKKAFAKYNGKYGILDAEKTASELASGNYAPLTGDYNVIYVFVLTFACAFIIAWLYKFEKNKKVEIL